MSRRGPIIAGAVSAVLAILLVVFLVLPKMGDVSEAQDQLTAAQDREQSLRLELAQLKAAEEESVETQRKIEEIENLIPPTVDQVGMIRLLETTATAAGCDFQADSTGVPTPAPEGTFSLIAVGVTVNCTYFQLAEYLYGIETLPRAAKVLDVAISTNDAGGTEGTALVVDPLSAQLTIEFYTTDLNAGPGSDPGPSDTAGVPAAGV